MATPIIITDEEYKTFHKIDRELYLRLVTTINREPIESMQIMGLWLWLEQVGFPNIILKMLSLTDQVVQVIAEEAVRCINCLASSVLPVSTNTDIPITRNLMEKPITLQFIHDNRDVAIPGIAKIVSEVCLRAFNDIVEEVMAKAAKESVPLGNVSGGSDHDQQGSGDVRVGNTTLMYPAPAPLVGPGLVCPVYQHPSIGLSPSALVVGGSVLGQHPSHQGDIGSILNPQAQPYNPTVPTVPTVPTPTPTPTPTPAPTGTGEVPQNDRTMFVTFSRGYPMTEDEVYEFFTKKYGKCIEDIHFQVVLPHEQSLFARLIFYSSMKISEILDGNNRVKFNINGKHVWARRYEVQGRDQVRQGRRRGSVATE